MMRKSTSEVSFVTKDVHRLTTTKVPQKAARRSLGSESCGFRLKSEQCRAPSRPVGFMSQLKARLARALRFGCVESRRRCRSRSSRKVGSSSLPRSRSYAEPINSHQAEAIEDCIEFLNSSSMSAFRRSTSVSSNAW